MADCVGCGFCCTKSVCAAGLRIHGPVTKCPSLIWDEEKGRHICKLVTIPGDIGLRYRKELYIGDGCCASMFNTWRDNLQDRTDSKKYEIVKMDKYFKLFLHSLGKQWISGDVINLTIGGFVGDLRRLNTSEEKIGELVKEIAHTITQNRASYLEEFLG